MPPKAACNSRLTWSSDAPRGAIIRRLAALLMLWLGLTAPAFAADADWSGSWDTRWPEGAARVELRQHGTDVAGTYRLYDGRIVGKASGDRLEGEWIEGDRRGHFVFIQGPLRQAFTGQFDDGDWWTGQRATGKEILPEIRDRSAKETLRSFLLAGNWASAGVADAWADAVQLIDFGAGNLPADAREDLSRGMSLFDAMSLTTFRIASLSDAVPDAPSVEWQLPQAGTDVRLRITLVRLANGAWRIAQPAPDELAASYRDLLKRYGNRPPAADAIQALRSPRDTMRSFVESMRDWDTGGRQRVLDTMDLSGIRAGYRIDQGLVQAQYMMQVINRVGAWQWQEIPDDPASREPYVFFAHGAGNIVIAPQTQGDQTKWRFTADTVDAQLRLYIVTQDMPPIWGMPMLVPRSGLFAFRQRLGEISPYLLARSVVVALENWQLIAFVGMLLVAAIVMLLIVPLIIKGLGLLVQLVGQPLEPERARRLVWPLRLIAIALIWFDFSRRIGMAGPALTIVDSAMGVIAATGIAWAGLPLLDAIAAGLYGRTRQTTGTMDDIMVSLTAGMLKLLLIAGVALAAAQAVDIPVAGMLAGLGIGGLAVAFASKEALSNLFGAAILLADRPFRNGDTIAIGDVQGTVEHVGIRSTRIRTLDDTVIVLPNGKLSDALINNYGARRYRLFRTRFHVSYGATPEQLEAFTQKLRKVIDVHPATVEERTQIGLAQLADDGIEFDLVCYFRAETAAEERAARHELLLQVMRLAEQAGVRFTGGT